MKTIIFASGNEGKVQEVKDIFKDTHYKIISLTELDDVPEIIEDGKTFEENARIKAETIFKKFGMPVMSDDSGLEVDQLFGAPGVFSARYAGAECSYEDNNRKLIAALLEKAPPHKARFVCCAYYIDDELSFHVTGEMKGEITKEPRGTNGFGYDPIFKPEGYEETLAELKLDEKNSISHRARAFSKLKLQMLEEVH